MTHLRILLHTSTYIYIHQHTSTHINKEHSTHAATYLQAITQVCQIGLHMLPNFILLASLLLLRLHLPYPNLAILHLPPAPLHLRFAATQATRTTLHRNSELLHGISSLLLNHINTTTPTTTCFQGYTCLLWHGMWSHVGA